MAHVTRPVYMPTQHAFASISTFARVDDKVEVASDEDTDASSQTAAEIEEQVSSIDGESETEHANADHGYQTDDDMYHPVYYMAIPPQVAPGNFHAILPSIPQSPLGHRQFQTSPTNLVASPTFALSPKGNQLWSARSPEPEPQPEKHEARRRGQKAKAVPQQAPQVLHSAVTIATVPSTSSTPDVEVEDDADRTTVMLKNLPKGLSRTMLLELLEKKGFVTKCNFVYLPVEFTRRSCMGYAFVNLESPGMVPEFWSAFEGLSEWPVPSSKICRVTWSSPLQGLSEHVERFRNSPLMHATVPDECRPILLSNGLRSQFPTPSKTLRAPRPRASRSMRPFWQGDVGDADTEC